jgi:hypothetical protein
VLCRLQQESVHKAMYYDAQPRQSYGGLFKLMTTTPSKSFYAMKAYHELYKLGFEAPSFSSDGSIGLCAASDGKHIAAILCNYRGGDMDLSIDIQGLPQDKKLSGYLLDGQRNLELIGEYDAEITIELKNNTLLLLVDH